MPWCFIYDKANCARYLSVHYAQMTNVSEVYPCVYEALNSG